MDTMGSFLRLTPWHRRKASDDAKRIPSEEAVACGADEDSSRMLAVTSPGRLEGQRASANRPGAPVPRDQEQAPRLAKHLFASGARRRSRSPRVKAAGGLNDDALRGCSRSFSSACAAGCANCCRSWVALFALALVWLYVMWAALGHGWDALAGALHESAASGTKTQKPVALCGVANLVSTTLHLRNDAQARKLPTHANMLQTLLLQRPGRNYTDAFEHMVPDVPNAVGDSGDDGPSDDVIGDAALRVSTSSSEFGFKLYNPATLTYSDVRWCPGSQEPAADELRPLPEAYKVLFVLGAQKAGTTWFYNALQTHPAFVGPERGYMREGTQWAKELHFFNRWPMPTAPADNFLQCFPDSIALGPSTWRDGASAGAKALVDATPEYIFNSVAAPRIKAIVPQAKFVIILRDPVARAYSAWKMTHRALCPDADAPCDLPGFGEVVARDLAASKLDGCGPENESSTRSWHTCFQCIYSHVNSTACDALPQEERQAFSRCQGERGASLIDVSNYAAQLAWWLAFFPPERFLIFSALDLREDANRLRILNKVAQHAGVGQDAPFTQATLDAVEAYNGEYEIDLAPGEQDAVSTLRRAMTRPQQDLDRLLTMYGMDTLFSGLPPEI